MRILCDRCDHIDDIPNFYPSFGVDKNSFKEA